MFWRRKQARLASFSTPAKPSKAKIILRPEAAREAIPGEKIIEFSCNDLGGLLSIRPKADGGAIVELFACDNGLELRFNRDSSHSGGLS